MKRILTLCLLAVTMCATAQDIKKVAVYVTGADNAINRILGDKFVSAFAQSGKYIATERTSTFLTELAKENSYQQSGMVSDLDIVRMGNEFGAKLVCVVNIEKVFDKHYISARLIDVTTKEIVNAANTTSVLSSIEDLVKVSNTLTPTLCEVSIEQKAQGTIKWKNAITNGYFEYDNLMVTVNAFVAGYNEIKKNSFNFAGYTDWRLISIQEFMSISRYLRTNQPEFYKETWGKWDGTSSRIWCNDAHQYSTYKYIYEISDKSYDNRSSKCYVVLVRKITTKSPKSNKK